MSQGLDVEALPEVGILLVRIRSFPPSVSGDVRAENQDRMSKTCPKCGLLNPDTGLLCDCGLRFDEKTAVEGHRPTPRG